MTSPPLGYTRVMSDLTEVKSRNRRPVRRVQNPFGCLGCLGSTAGTMALFAVVIWAFNPDMSAREALREGILWGGGATLAATTLFCGVPVALLVAAIAWVLIRRRPNPSRSGPTIIDIE